MTSRNISYHTRLYSDNTRKLVGGSFGGSIDIETANRLVNSHFTVVIKPSGHPVFVDKEGREVSLYIHVDAASTEQGVKALAAWRAARTKQDREDQARRELERAEIEELMANLPPEEIVRRLRAEP